MGQKAVGSGSGAARVTFTDKRERDRVAREQQPAWRLLLSEPHTIRNADSRKQ